MECFVTGGSGFVGLHLLAYLTARGHKTWVLMRNLRNLERLRAQVRSLGGNSACILGVKGDLSISGLGLSDADKYNVSSAQVIFHLAAQFSWGLTIEEARAVNVKGALRVAELAVVQQSRFLMVGGYMIKNDAHLARVGIDTQHPEKTDWVNVYNRVGGYEGSKLEAHLVVTRYLEAQSADYAVVHPATVYGHSESGHILKGQPTEQLIRNLSSGKLKAIPGNSEHWLPLVSVDYLVALITHLGFDSSAARQQVLALNEATPSLSSLVKEISNYLGVRAPNHYIPKGLLRFFLTIPGMENRLATSRESLSFIQKERFDMSISKHFETKYKLNHPDFRSTLEKTVNYVKNT